MKKFIKFICLVLALSVLIGFIPNDFNKLFAEFNLQDDINSYLQNLHKFEKKYSYNETNIVINLEENLLLDENDNYLISLSDYTQLTNAKEININNDKLITYNEDAVMIIDSDEDESITQEISSYSNKIKVAKVKKVDLKNINQKEEKINSNLISNVNYLDINSQGLDEVYVDVTEISNGLGFGVREASSEIVLSRSFESKQLVVIYDGKSFNSRGAIDYINYNRLYLCQYASEKDAKNAFKEFLQDETILMVSPNTTTYLMEDEFSTMNDEISADEKTFVSWGADFMAIDNYSKLIENCYMKNNLQDVTVAVLDTGIDTDHSWFKNKDGSSKISYTYGQDFTGNVFEFEDGNGHGTHVSGTIAELNFDNIDIIPLKVLKDDGRGNINYTFSALEYIKELSASGVNVAAINMSLGLFLDPKEYTEFQISYLESIYKKQYENYFSDLIDTYNIAPIVAAGNDETDLDVLRNVYPACVSNAITISALTKNYNSVTFASSYSNYGTFIDFSAPGSAIRSAAVGGGTTSKSGTSMATPHACGAYILLKSVYPNKSVEQLIQILKDNAVDLGDSGKDDYYGYGLINLNGLIKNINFDYINSKVYINDIDISDINNTFLATSEKNVIFKVKPKDGFSITNITIKIGNNTIVLSQVEIIATQNQGYELKNVTTNINVSITEQINTHMVTVNQPQKGGIFDLNSRTFEYGEAVNFNITIYPGYSLDKIIVKNEKNEDVDFVETEQGYKIEKIKENLTISSEISANKNTKYIINHLYQNLNLEYELKDSKESFGVTDTLTNALVQNKTGFKVVEFINQNINGDESTVVNLYYDRELYNLEVTNLENIEDISIKILNGVVSNKQNCYYFEQKIEITSVSKEGYEIISYTSNNPQFNYFSSSPLAEVYMPAHDLSLKINTQIKKYLINTNKKGKGSITDSKEIEYMSSFKVEFSPIENYHLQSVTVDGQLMPEALENGYFLFENINANHIISVVFEINKISINASSSNDKFGYVYPSGAINLAYGSNIEFSFHTYEGYEIKKILINDKEIDKSLLVYKLENVTTAQNIYLELEPIKYTINLKSSASTHGTIECEKDLSKINHGEDVDFKITPESGYKIEKVFLNGVSIDIVNNSFTIKNINQNHTINIIYNTISESTSSNFTPNYLIYIIIGAGVLLLVILVVTIIIVSKKSKNKNTNITMKDSKEFTSNVKEEKPNYADKQEIKDTQNDTKPQNENPFLNNGRFKK